MALNNKNNVAIVALSLIYFGSGLELTINGDVLVFKSLKSTALLSGHIQACRGPVSDDILVLFSSCNFLMYIYCTNLVVIICNFCQLAI